MRKPVIHPEGSLEFSTQRFGRFPALIWEKNEYITGKNKKDYHEYPSAFWIYNLIVFIDRLGGFMLYPFFALYLTERYGIGMSTVGIIFAIFSISGMVGSALGGAVADRMGRRTVIIFSLLLSSLSALGMGFAPTLGIFVVVSILVGTLAHMLTTRMKVAARVA